MRPEVRAGAQPAAGRTHTPPPARSAGVVELAAAAQTAVARQRIKQALDACRKAAQRLAAAQTVDVYAHRACTSDRDVDAAAAVIRLALSEHDQVDVVVLVCPR